MLIPLGTDAPIYHWPIATVALLVANVAASIAFWTLDEEAARQWILVYGEGLHPWQWITSNFVHADIFHLLGNLIYLWGFGLVVEGKVGWLGFLPIYFGLGIAECSLEQVLMLGVEPGTGGSLGASAIVFGLIAMGLVWAPQNEISFILIVLWQFMIRVVEFELTIVTFAILYFVWEGMLALLHGVLHGWQQPGSGLIHLFGAALGFVLATVLLKMGLVDCEGWDLYRRGWWGRAPAESRKQVRKRRKKPARKPVDVEARSQELLDGLRAAIHDDAALEALGCYQALKRLPEGWRPLEPDYLKLIALLQRSGYTAESLPLIHDYLGLFPDSRQAAAVRLKLAQILLRDQRPARALRVLAEVVLADLPENLRPIHRKIQQEAERLREEGVLELDEP